MMEVFFDKDFISKHKWDFGLDDDINVSFYFNFIKKLNGLKVFLNVNEEYFKNKHLLSDEEKLFIKAINDSNPKIVFHENPTDTKGWITDSCKRGGFRIFFYELDDNSSKSVASRLGYLVVSSTNFIGYWRNFIKPIIKKHYNNEADINDPNLFNTWEDLGFIGDLPNNSIVIADSYIFTNSEYERQICEHNLIPLLYNISPKNYTGDLNIIIIFKDLGYNNKRDHIKKLDKFLAYVHNEIIRYFENKEYTATLKFHFINNVPQHHDVADFHPRFIATNHYWIDFEKGINLFEYRNKRYQRINVTGGYLQINSIMTDGNQDYYHKTIGNVNNFIRCINDRNNIFKVQESGEKPKERRKNLAYRLCFFPEDSVPECMLLLEHPI